MAEWEFIGVCSVCSGRIYYNSETKEVDRSDCICNHILRCGYPAFFQECRNAVGQEGCLGDKDKQHPKCPAG